MKNNKLSKMKKFIFILLSVLIILVSITLGGSYLYITSKLSKIKTVSIPKDPLLLGISPNMIPKETDNKSTNSSIGSALSTSSSNGDVAISSKITNILILGKDSRNLATETGNSDSIMILTIDEKHDKLKLTSIMRDSYVEMDGHASQKITNSHEFGGALFTLKTVNENYAMNITDYMEVNLYGFAKIIDSVGGITINLKSNEIYWANYYIKEMSEVDGVEPALVTTDGIQTLSGIQAVAYSRIRYVGNNDFERTHRQRTVLTLLFNKLRTTNIVDIPKVIDILMPNVETSLKPNDIISFATYILSHKIATLEQSRVPYDDLYHDEVIDKADVLIWDKKPTIDRLHQFIFESN